MAGVSIYNRNRSQPKWSGVRLQRGFLFGAIMVAALAAFELFNFGTTDYALRDLLGSMEVFGVGWSSVLAVAFCAIDFAGLARLFTPEQGRDEPKEIWYLMGAWLLGACANAVMTWWAITLALLSRPLGNEVLARDQLIAIVPVFVAALVWLTRVMIIGTFGIAGERIFTLGTESRRFKQLSAPSASRSRSAAPSRKQPRPTQRDQNENLTYEPVRPSTSEPPSYGRTRPAPKPGAAPAASYGYSMAPVEKRKAWEASSLTFAERAQNRNWLQDDTEWKV